MENQKYKNTDAVCTAALLSTKHLIADTASLLATPTPLGLHRSVRRKKNKGKTKTKSTVSKLLSKLLNRRQAKEFGYE